MEMNRKIEKAKKIDARIARDHRAKEADIPLRILELDKEFDEVLGKYADWPQPLPTEEVKEALAEYRDKISFDKLRELPCAVCSEIHAKGDWKKVLVERVDLSLLKAPIELTESSFGIDFVYASRRI